MYLFIFGFAGSFAAAHRLSRVAASRGYSLVAASRGYSLVAIHRLSLCGLSRCRAWVLDPRTSVVAGHQLSLVVLSRGYSYSWCAAFTVLQSPGSRHVAAAVVAHGLSFPRAGRTFLDQGLNLRPLCGRWIPNHWTTREVLSLTVHGFQSQDDEKVSPYMYAIDTDSYVMHAIYEWMHICNCI